MGRTVEADDSVKIMKIYRSRGAWRRGAAVAQKGDNNVWRHDDLSYASSDDGGIHPTAGGATPVDDIMRVSTISCMLRRALPSGILHLEVLMGRKALSRRSGKHAVFACLFGRGAW